MQNNSTPCVQKSDSAVVFADNMRMTAATGYAAFEFSLKLLKYVSHLKDATQEHFVFACFTLNTAAVHGLLSLHCHTCPLLCRLAQLSNQ